MANSGDNSTERIGLSELVDLSIGTPEKGSVNFNLIRSVLHILIKQIIECTHETIFIEFKSPHADIIRNLKKNSIDSSKSFDFFVIKEKKNDMNTEKLVTQKPKISKESRNQKISSKNTGQDSKNDSDSKMLALDVDNSLVLFTQQIKTLQDQHLTFTLTINYLTSRVKEIEGIIRNLIPTQMQISPVTIEPKFCKLFQSFRHESGYKSIKDMEIELDSNYLDSKEVKIIFEKKNVTISDLSDSNTSESDNELNKCKNSSKSYINFKKDPNSNQNTHVKKLVSVDGVGTITQHQLNINKISSSSQNRKEIGQEKLTGRSNIQSEEKAFSLKDNSQTSSQLDHRGVQKSNVADCDELTKYSKVQYQDSFGNKVSTFKLNPDSKSNSFQEQSIKKHKNIVSNKSNINFTHHCLFGTNRNCTSDDPNYINCDMYDDKGLIKPMYDVGSFKSAYVRETNKKLGNEIQQSYNTNTSSQHYYYHGTGDITGNVEQQTLSEKENNNNENEVKNVVQIPIGHKISYNDITNKLSSTLEINNKKTNIIDNRDHTKTIKKMAQSELEENHQKNSFELSKNQPDSYNQQLNQSEIHILDNNNPKLQLKADDSDKKQLNSLNLIHIEPNTKISIMPKLQKSFDVVCNKKIISTERLILEMDCELRKGLNRRNAPTDLGKYSDSTWQPKNILKRGKIIEQMNCVVKPNTKYVVSCPILEKVGKNLKEKNSIQKKYAEDIENKKPKRGLNNLKKDIVEIRQVLYDKPSLPFRSVEKDKQFCQSKNQYGNKSTKTLHFMDQSVDSKMSTDSSFNLIDSSNNNIPHAINKNSYRMVYQQSSSLNSLNGVNKLKELAEIVSEILNQKSFSGDNKFQDKTGDALNIVQQILEEINNNTAVNSNNKTINQFQTLLEKMENLENEIKLFSESGKIQEYPFPNTNVDFTNNREVFNAIRDLQKQVHTLCIKIDENTETIQSNKHCIDTLSEYVKEMDSRKTDTDQLDTRLATLVKTYSLEQKVNKEEFNQECEVRDEAMQIINTKLDIHKKYQELQSTIINKLFEILSNKISRKEMKSMKDKLMEELHKTEEKILGDYKTREEDGASGTKKPVLRDLQCISCNKDVFMKEKIFPINQSFQPSRLTTQQDDLRNKGTLMNTNNSAGIRYSGGSHTKISSAQKKIITKKSPLKRYPPLSISELEKLYGSNVP